METVSSTEMEADGNAPNDLQVALILQDRLHKLSAGLLSGDELTKLLSILEIAAQEFGIYVEKHVNYYKRREKTKDIEGEGTKIVVCRHSCSSHTELLNPALWSSLPHEVLRLIFARLPLCDFQGLKCLSKDWNTVVTTDSNFHRLCDAVHGSSFALVDMSHRVGSFWVRAFNVKFNKWDNFLNTPALAKPPDKLVKASPSCNLNTSVLCGDDGLLCFVSSLFFWSKGRMCFNLFITVVNPLTGMSHALPPLLRLFNMRMVELIVSSEMTGFKVFVLVNYSALFESDGTAQVYDSTKRSWGRAEGSSGFIFGRRCYLAGGKSCEPVFFEGPCAYDFASGRLLDIPYEIGAQSEDLDDLGVTYVQYKDRFFVLRMGTHGPANDLLATQTSTNYIEELIVQMPTRTWVKVCTHRCDPFEHPPKSRAFIVRLRACKGSLLIRKKQLERACVMNFNSMALRFILT